MTTRIKRTLATAAVLVAAGGGLVGCGDGGGGGLGTSGVIGGGGGAVDPAGAGDGGDGGDLPEAPALPEAPEPGDIETPELPGTDEGGGEGADDGPAGTDEEAGGDGPQFTCGEFKAADVDGKIAYGQEVLDAELNGGDLESDDLEAFPDEETAAISVALAVDAVCREMSDDQVVGDIDDSEFTGADFDPEAADPELVERLTDSAG